ncbi:MAG: hypothetical protein HYZ72_00365 [Deltaproteobacteria bacterium]|nr:hypothetical protein [Deltaproteobacteria bacterium]
MGGLKAQIQAAFGLVDADFISVPVLFDRFPGGRAEAITPGLANGAVYAGVYIAPDPFLHVFGAGAIEEDTNRNFMLDAGEDTNGDGLLDTLRDPFQVYVNGVLPAGVTAAYIDDWTTYHLGAGEVHCSSNEKRRIPAVKWWE